MLIANYPVPFGIRSIPLILNIDVKREESRGRRSTPDILLRGFPSECRHRLQRLTREQPRGQCYHQILHLNHETPPALAVAEFDFSFRVSSNSGLGKIRIVAGGTGCDDYSTDLSGVVSVPNTGGWYDYEDVVV